MRTFMRRLMLAAAIVLCAKLFAGGAAHAGAPANAPKTVYGGGVLTPDTKHICPAGPFAFYVYPDGHSACLAPGQFPPRNPADCPKGTTYKILTRLPQCVPNVPFRVLPLPAGEPPPIECRTDADCPNGSVCYVNRFGGGQCGEPPGYHPTVP